MGGHKVPCEFNLEKKDPSLENNDQLTKDEKLSDEKFTNGLTQEIKLRGKNCPMILFFEMMIWNSKEMPMNQWVCYSKIKNMRNYGCRTKFLVMSLKLNTHAGYLNLMI